VGVELAVDVESFFPALNTVQEFVLDVFHGVRGDEAAVAFDRRAEIDSVVEEFVRLADFLHEAQTKGGIRVDHLAG
jgi:hypothetical protein